ncbi:MAG: hypothetical protein P0Y55_01195 [Candidatus Cohnella colombiensis]|uniref:Uncharacterized protein n=1 Tax=Candidatus Cohnella colombiensis TaxID=3121368 RepID=A0AA95EXN4_9BACL|nr:MAG: hypothetical protein P0Y55_01195 [Cohnella sp.]
MKFNFNSWNLGGKSIFISACLAIVSLFFNWVEFSFISQNGIEQDAYLFLAVFIYPVLVLLQEKPLNQIIGYICAVIGVICGIAYINAKSTTLFGTTINASGTGPYIFIVACILLAFGTYKYARK